MSPLKNRTNTMKKSKREKTKASQATSQRLPGDDGFLKVSTLKRTLFFLSLVSNLPKDGPGLTPSLQEMAHDLFTELAVEINNCMQMRTIINILSDKLGVGTIADLLQEMPEDSFEHSDLAGTGAKRGQDQ